MKYLVVGLVFVLVGCSQGSSDIDESDINVKCLSGVNYYMTKSTRGYKGYGYMSPKYNRDGLVSLCN